MEGSPLIQQLAVVSTISGGTITGMKYALSLAERQPFAVFYKGLYSFLKEDILLGKALETLNNSAPWSGLPLLRNLINAFALIYDLLEHNDLSERLKTYIVQANQMGTTLWFSDPAAAGVSMPDALVVACLDRFSAV